MAGCRARRDASRRAAGVTCDRGSERRSEPCRRSCAPRRRSSRASSPSPPTRSSRSITAQRIVHFNRGAEEIFGYKASDAIGRHLAILLPPRFRAGHDAHMESFAQSPVTARRMGERREIFGLRADGTEFPAEASISKLVTPDGILFTVVLRDITVQKRAEEDERFLAARRASCRRRSPSTRLSAPSSICRFPGSPMRRCSTSSPQRSGRTVSRASPARGSGPS